MQPLTAPPRDGLTATQVMQLLVGASSVTYDRGLEVLDQNLNVVEDISDDFEGGSVTHTVAATIHGQCSLTISTDVDYGTQLLRPYMLLSAGGMTARVNGGVFVPFKPQTDYGSSVPSNVVTGFDRLYQLNRPVGTALSLSGDVLTLIRSVFEMAGIPATQVLLDNSAAGTQFAKTWPLLVDTSTTDVQPVDAVADSNNATTFLRVINDLLAAINYVGIWADWDGYFRSQPYIDPSARAVEWDMDFGSPQVIISPQRSVARDTSQTPNEWIFQQQTLPTDANGNTIEPTEGNGQYTVRNEDQGDTSITARGGDPLGVYSVVVTLDAADQPTLEALGDQQVASDENVATTYPVSTAPFPVAWHEDVYSYTDQAVLGGTAKVISTGWTCDYGDSTTPPADQQHTWALIA